MSTNARGQWKFSTLCSGSLDLDYLCIFDGL